MRVRVVCVCGVRVCGVHVCVWPAISLSRSLSRSLSLSAHVSVCSSYTTMDDSTGHQLDYDLYYIISVSCST